MYGLGQSSRGPIHGYHHDTKVDHVVLKTVTPPLCSQEGDRGRTVKDAVSAYEEMRQRAQLDFAARVADSQQVSRENIGTYLSRMPLRPRAQKGDLPRSGPDTSVSVLTSVVRLCAEAAERAKARLAEIMAQVEKEARARVESESDARNRARFVRLQHGPTCSCTLFPPLWR